MKSLCWGSLEKKFPDFSTWCCFPAETHCWHPKLCHHKNKNKHSLLYLRKEWTSSFGNEHCQVAHTPLPPPTISLHCARGLVASPTSGSSDSEWPATVRKQIWREKYPCHKSILSGLILQSPLCTLTCQMSQAVFKSNAVKSRMKVGMIGIYLYQRFTASDVNQHTHL